MHQILLGALDHIVRGGGGGGGGGGVVEPLTNYYALEQNFLFESGAVSKELFQL